MTAFIDYVLGHSFYFIAIAALFTMWRAAEANSKTWHNLNDENNRYWRSEMDRLRAQRTETERQSQAHFTRVYVVEQQHAALKAAYDALVPVAFNLRLLKPLPVQIINPEFPRKLERMQSLLLQALETNASMSPPKDDDTGRTRSIVLAPVQYG